MLVWVQGYHEQLAELAMAIFLKNSPNDPRSLLETREHGSAMAGAHMLTDSVQGGREEVDLHSWHGRTACAM